MTLLRERRVILAVKDDIHRSKVTLQQLIFGEELKSFHQIYCEGKGGTYIIMGTRLRNSEGFTIWGWAAPQTFLPTMMDQDHRCHDVG